jgi:hypothetical protein
MVVATSYPLLDAFLTLLWVFAFVLWIWLIIVIFTDIMRSRDLSGWGRALWALFVIIVPLFGALIYLIARGGKMRERELQDVQAQQQAVADYRRAAASNGAADEVAKLALLRDRNVITEEEFQREKTRVLSG